MLTIFFEGMRLEIKKDNSIKAINLSHEIGQAIVWNNKIIVRFELGGSSTPERNIICLNEAGEQIWQIRDPDEWRTGKKFSPRDLFGYLWVDNNSNIWARGRESEYRLNPKNGDILEEVYTK